ncbi:uncharacterized protein LOC121867993 [Homarus americanus]|uniref:Low-density lipoprotein receptor-related protein-like 2 n=1 Tax=Homarus americanus TaxID=6706 RepID=A0A8J5MXR6_HOMAM|nr:uncharacterized protein LOC121867993 [Homarus americanus]KAG7167828.1 Low-density lipoprotein receptor-related protein-like 2 [Homarus americanus]
MSQFPSVAGVVLLLLLLACSCVTGEKCSTPEEVKCASHHKCIPLRYVCDNDQDCDDHSDEDLHLCRAWRNDCSRGEVRCKRQGESSCVSIPAYCRMQYPPCEGDLDLRICQMLHNKQLQSLDSVVLTDYGLGDSNLGITQQEKEEFLLAVNSTLQHPACPPLYTLLDGACLSVFYPGAVSWGEARGFCKVIGGDLLTLNNVSQYTALLTHLHHTRMTRDFWVGGRYVNHTQGWTWINHASINLGSPYWALRYEGTCQNRNVTSRKTGRTRLANGGTCYHYQQAPHHHPVGWCVALTYQHYYYMTDEDCILRKSPLCVYTHEDIQQLTLI